MTEEDEARRLTLEILGVYAYCEGVIDVLVDWYMEDVPPGIVKALVRRPLTTQAQVQVLAAAVAMEGFADDTWLAALPARHGDLSDFRNTLAHSEGTFTTEGAWQLRPIGSKPRKPPKFTALTFLQLGDRREAMAQHRFELLFLLDTVIKRLRVDPGEHHD